MLSISKKTVILSLFFQLFQKLISKGIGLVISIFLARLLLPEYFGIIAMMLAFISIMELFIENGLGTALIQNEETSNSDYSTVFWAFFFFSSFLYLCIFISTPYLMCFLKIEQYITHFRTLLSILIFNSYTAITNARLMRSFNFKIIFVCNITTALISGAIGISIALFGFGIWALILYYFFSSLITALLYFLLTRWVPEFIFDITRFKIFLSYGYKLMISGALTAISYNLRTFIIGKMFTPTNLAYFSRGEQIPAIIATTVDSSIASVILPLYSRNQNNIDILRNLIRRTIRFDAYFIFPAMIGLYCIAAPLIEFIYTEKWMSSVYFLKVYALSNINVAIICPLLIGIKSLGKADSILRLEFIRRFVMLLIILTSFLFFSLECVALAWLLFCLVDVYIIMYVSKKIFKYDLMMLFDDIKSQLFLSICMGICIFFIEYTYFNGLISKILFGVFVYILLSFFTKNKEFNDIVNIISIKLRYK